MFRHSSMMGHDDQTAPSSRISQKEKRESIVQFASNLCIEDPHGRSNLRVSRVGRARKADRQRCNVAFTARIDQNSQ